MQPHVRILMATYNGAAFLPEQLESFVGQSHTNWSLVMSDDNSDDETRDVAERFAEKYGERDILIRQGPCRGSAANFLSLAALPSVQDDCFIALSDQDDIWMPHRLSRAVDFLTKSGTGSGPAVYASRTILMREDGTPRGPSRLHRRSPAFGNAVVQNILAGNTLVLNPAAAALLRRTVAAAVDVPHHDWWIYQLMSGAGAQILIDPEPGLYYRQHDNNLLGANRGLRQGMSRFGMIRDGRYRDWITRNQAALAAVSNELTPEARGLLDRFQGWRRGEIPLRRIGIWRHSGFGNLLLRLAAAGGRL